MQGWTYTCMNAACGYIERRTMLAAVKCPRCGWDMVPRKD